jgi:hypothetical protein
MFELSLEQDCSVLLTNVVKATFKILRINFVFRSIYNQIQCNYVQGAASLEIHPVVSQNYVQGALPLEIHPVVSQNYVQGAASLKPVVSQFL